MSTALLCCFWALSACNEERSSATVHPNRAKAVDSTGEIHDRIREFYSSYILANAKDDVDQRRVDQLLLDYCTPAFIKHIKSLYSSGELDADPIVAAQDFDENWVKTMAVTSIGKRMYKVCYQNSYNSEQICMRVAVEREAGTWKIGDISPFVSAN